MRHEAEMQAILKQVELWPIEERRWLALQLDKQRASDISEPAMSTSVEERRPFGDLIGIANPEGRSFTDAEVDDIRYQALRDKFLR